MCHYCYYGGECDKEGTVHEQECKDFKPDNYWGEDVDMFEGV